MSFQTTRGRIVITQSRLGGFLWLAIDNHGNHFLGSSATLAYARTDASIAMVRGGYAQ